MKKIILSFLALILFSQIALGMSKVNEEKFIENIRTCTPSYYQSISVLNIMSHTITQHLTEAISGNKNGKCRISSTTMSSKSLGIGEVCDLSSSDLMNYYKYRKQSLSKNSSNGSVNSSDFYYVPCVAYKYDKGRWTKDSSTNARLAIPRR